MKAVVFYVLLVLVSIQGALCWDQDELDLFDLVEEVEENFYELLQVEQSSTQTEIKRAYRQLSLKLHPDKSDDPDATDKFRKLVAVAEVLKDEQKRSWYDRILVEGLPDWRQPIYYYRRVRKMGLFEMSILLLLIASVGHYLFGWAVFVEKQLVLQEVLNRKQKKEKKSSKKSVRPVSSKLEAEVEYHTEQANASIPTLRNILPIILAKKCIMLSKFCWSFYSQWKDSLALKNQARTDRSEEVKGQSATDGTKLTQKRKYSGKKSTSNGHSSNNQQTPLQEAIPVASVLEGSVDKSTRLSDVTTCFEVADETAWTSDSESESENVSLSNYQERDLETQPTSEKNVGSRSKLAVDNAHPDDASSYPVSAPHTSKETGTEGKNSTQETAKENETSRPPLSEIAPNSLNGERIASWSQYQQRQLEWALGQYPKFSTERWENVAKAVPGKTMEDCVERCKELFAAVRKRKIDPTGTITC